MLSPLGGGNVDRYVQVLQDGLSPLQDPLSLVADKADLTVSQEVDFGTHQLVVTNPASSASWQHSSPVFATVVQQSQGENS